MIVSLFFISLCLSASVRDDLVCWHLPSPICLLSDGETKLRDSFAPVLGKRVGSLCHILDWYHLAKRCGEILSLACKGKDIRNAHRNAVTRLLWFGCVESAIAYVKAIPDSDLKNSSRRDDLAEYLLKHKGRIPVYAVRRQLGLPNSSNAVEKANDLLVSSRQKGKGMSWSQGGSSALAMVRMTMRNRQQRLWLEKRALSITSAILCYAAMASLVAILGLPGGLSVFKRCSNRFGCLFSKNLWAGVVPSFLFVWKL